MPVFNSCLFLFILRRSCHAHLSGSKKSLKERVAFVVLLDDGVRLVFLGYNLCDRFMFVGIKGFAHRGYWIDSVLAENFHKALENHFDALEQGLPVSASLGIVERALEIIQHRQQILDQTLVCVADRFRFFPRYAFFIIFQLRCLAKKAIVIFFRLKLFCFKLPAKFFALFCFTFTAAGRRRFFVLFFFQFDPFLLVQLRHNYLRNLITTPLGVKARLSEKPAIFKEFAQFQEKC